MDNHKYKIATLCGSTKFKKEFDLVARYLTLSGYIVINISPFYVEDDGLLPLDENVQHMFQEMHLQRIDMADVVVIVDPNGYVGDSTRKEIECAKTIGKPVEYASEHILQQSEKIFQKKQEQKKQEEDCKKDIPLPNDLVIATPPGKTKGVVCKVDQINLNSISIKANERTTYILLPLCDGEDSFEATIDEVTLIHRAVFPAMVGDVITLKEDGYHKQWFITGMQIYANSNVSITITDIDYRGQCHTRFISESTPYKITPCHPTGIFDKYECLQIGDEVEILQKGRKEYKTGIIVNVSMNMHTRQFKYDVVFSNGNTEELLTRDQLKKTGKYVTRSVICYYLYGTGELM